MKKIARYAAMTVSALALSATALVASPGPAQAAPPATLDINWSKTITYGQTARFAGHIRDAEGNEPTETTAFLQRRLTGQSGWSTIANDATPGSFAWSDKTPVTAVYRVVVRYQGEFLYTDSTYKTSVKRALSTPNLRTSTRTLAGLVKPSYKRHSVYVQVHTASGWKSWKRVYTDSYSRWKVKLPVKRAYYRAVVRASNGYLTSYSPKVGVRVVSYKTTTPVAKAAVPTGSETGAVLR